jgi:hypothetical protein
MLLFRVQTLGCLSASEARRKHAEGVNSERKPKRRVAFAQEINGKIICYEKGNICGNYHNKFTCVLGLPQPISEE